MTSCSSTGFCSAKKRSDEVATQLAVVDDAVVVSGSSTRSVIERIEIVMRRADGYTVTRPAADKLLIGRVVRKFASKRTAICTITVVSEPQRLVVSIHGEIGRDMVEPLKAAAAGIARADVDDLHVKKFSILMANG